MVRELKSLAVSLSNSTASNKENRDAKCRKQSHCYGASSEMGEATAKLLAQNGAKVVLGARRTEKLEKSIAEIHSQGGTAEFRAVEVTHHNDVKVSIHFAKALKELRKIFLTSDAIPRAVLYAISQPDDADINRAIVRSTCQVMPVM
jgi:NADP-dependent 3-hydroxy acid dehydrogenase YdfG